MGIDPRSLQIGQLVAVKELNYGVLLQLPSEGETALTVVEVNREYLMLDDPALDSRRRIPLYLISKSASAAPEIHEAA